MRHRMAGRKLNRSRTHYQRLMQNLMCQLFQHHRIVTTITKAKEVRPQAEKLITLARTKTLANVRRAVMLLETVEATELIGPHVGAEQLLMRLFGEEEPRVYATQPVRFGCTCGPEKVVRTLSVYSAEEIAGMTTPDGKVTADCQFCGAHYEFDPAELGRQDTSPRR